MKSFLDEITEWTDTDICQFILCQNLGLLPEDAEFSKNKHFFWTKNDVGLFSHSMLIQLHAFDFIDYNEDAEQYRKKIK